jgi:hypothetical protein
MTTPTPDLTFLFDRLDRLERDCRTLRSQARRLKTGGICALILALGAGLIAAENRSTGKTLEAEKIILRDQKGRQRAKLALVPNQAKSPP